MLPSEFGPWQTVNWWFRSFVRRLLFRTIHDGAIMLDRERAGREASPTGSVVNSQTVKAPFAAARGYDLQALGNQRCFLRRRPLPPTRRARDQLNAAVLSAIVPVLMPGIKLGTILPATCTPDNRRQSAGPSGRATT